MKVADKKKIENISSDGNNTTDNKRMPRVPSILNLMQEIQPYNIIEEFKNTPANISLAQLLAVSNPLRAEVTKSFRRSKPEQAMIVGLADYQNARPEFELVNNPNHGYQSKKVQEHDIAVVRGLVEGSTAVVLIDGCSNANLVTRKFLNEVVKEYSIIGTVSGRVHQAMSDTEEYTYEIVPL
ncbi:hypothetical protein BCR32DRAFT_248998 [Anaeromyces robustus]|uniref:Uncharacterized protein n=1 Tax=Anaeromyces robustus TaxID=1754192 RepID=A0A1Y1WRF0_9FUNG|nr:hypothetical protein BCR32DRAFT_248998 [Anaeromyces robustus]|eukprot:ORX76123.1 hypothetical protein BCR32DRAFT_248998 [Anaeromyces robustus]